MAPQTWAPCPRSPTLGPMRPPRNPGCRPATPHSVKYTDKTARGMLATIATPDKTFECHLVLNQVQGAPGLWRLGGGASEVLLAALASACSVTGSPATGCSPGRR